MKNPSNVGVEEGTNWVTDGYSSANCNGYESGKQLKKQVYNRGRKITSVFLETSWKNENFSTPHHSIDFSAVKALIFTAIVFYIVLNVVLEIGTKRTAYFTSNKTAFQYLSVLRVIILPWFLG